MPSAAYRRTLQHHTFGRATGPDMCWRAIVSGVCRWAAPCSQPPMITVGAPDTMVPPCAVMSPSRAAGLPESKTVVDPLITVEGGPTHTHMLLRVAAGSAAMITVGAPGTTMGPPTCGTTPVTMGQTCTSVMRDAGGMVRSVSGLCRLVRAA